MNPFFNKIGTPLMPMPQQHQNKRLPPKIIPLRYKPTKFKKIPSPTLKIAQSTNTASIISTDSNIQSPRLPVISIKTHRFSASNSKLNNYSKNLPKFQKFKPLFHDRVKSHDMPQEEDEEYTSMRNNISWRDYK